MTCRSDVYAAACGWAAAGGSNCLLCDAAPPAFVVGVYVANPDESVRLGAQPGQTRNVIYSLCEDCCALDGVAQMVEAEIAARLVP